ncbi:MAG: response regulator [Anaerolineales bacterium]|nr:response regulator [Anaerolineales bacterium]
MGITLENEPSYKPLILVVDDNPEYLNGIKLTLEMEGFKVLTAHDGQQALDRLHALPIGQSKASPEAKRLPDLILADIMMPVMDGYDLYDRIRSHPYTNISLIFLTAKSGDEDVRLGKELGAEDYLSKLASTEDLLASVRGKLNRVGQQRAVMTEFHDNMGQSGNIGGIILLVVIILLIILAFYLGTLFS